MSRYRKGAGGKRDENEPDIIKVLRAHGCVVMQLSGKGIPDLLVLRNGTKWLADVKMPGKPTTEAQEELWEEAATKARCAVFILRTPEDAQKMLNNALQPWEPAVTGSIRAPRSHGYDRRPRKGDAAKAREEEPERRVCSFCGHVRVAHGRRGCTKAHPRGGTCRCAGDTIPRSSYTPPRSKPVDAAKEAEATFAPSGWVKCCIPSCQRSVRVIGATCVEHSGGATWPQEDSEAWDRGQR